MQHNRRHARPLSRPLSGLPLSAVVLAAALFACTSVLAACGGRQENENKITPIRASLTVDPVSSNPAVFFRAAPDPDPSDDLVFIDVVLRSATSPQFDAFDLEIHYNPGLIQFADLRDDMQDVSTPFGICNTSVTCNSSATTNPLCRANGRDANTTGDLLIGVASVTGCPSVTVPGEITLLTLGFVAATTIDPANPSEGRVELVPNDPSPTATGECEILSVVGGVPTDLGIPCDDGNATITATR